MIAPDYTRWLSRCRDPLLPTYFSVDYGKSATHWYDEVRYSFLMKYLAEWRKFHGVELRDFESRLAGVLKGRSHRGQQPTLAARIFLAHAELLDPTLDLGTRAHFSTLCSDLTEHCLADMDLIALGHLAALCSTALARISHQG